MTEEASNILDRFKLPIALSLLGLVLIIGGVFASGINKAETKEFPKESMVQSTLISVDVSGQVKNSGVYQLKEGSRMQDAISSAGGFTDKANQGYISKYLNLAQKLVDGSKVYIPAEGETTVGGGGTVMGVSSQGSKININTASQSDLETLPGIGPVIASKIISGRPYQKTEQLLEKKVVSKAVFEKIKELLELY